MKKTSPNRRKTATRKVLMVPRKNTEEWWGTLSASTDGNTATLTAGPSELHFMKSCLWSSYKGFWLFLFLLKMSWKFVSLRKIACPGFKQSAGCVWEGNVHPVSMLVMRTFTKGRGRREKKRPRLTRSNCFQNKTGIHKPPLTSHE